MHIFESGLGRLWIGGVNQVPAYSGAGEGKNNPLLQHIANVGPIPVGAWLLGEVDDTHGPLSIHLVHLFGELWGRSGFLLHGDNALHIGASSEGCIIAAHPEREYLADCRDRLLIVVAELPSVH